MALTIARRTLLLAQGSRALSSEDGGKKLTGLDSLFAKAKTGSPTDATPAASSSSNNVEGKAASSTADVPAAAVSNADAGTSGSSSAWSQPGAVQPNFLSSAGSSDRFQDLMQDSDAPVVSDTSNPWFTDIVGGGQGLAGEDAADASASQQGAFATSSASGEAQYQQEQSGGGGGAAWQVPEGEGQWQVNVHSEQPQHDEWQGSIQQQQQPVHDQWQTSIHGDQQQWQASAQQDMWQQQQQQQSQTPHDQWQQQQQAPHDQWQQQQQLAAAAAAQVSAQEQWMQPMQEAQQQQQQLWQQPADQQQQQDSLWGAAAQQQGQQPKQDDDTIKVKALEDNNPLKVDIPMDRVFKPRTPSLWDRISGTPPIPVDHWKELDRYAEETPPLDDVSPIYRDADGVKHYVPQKTFTARAEHLSALRQQLHRKVDRLQHLYSSQPTDVAYGNEFRQLRHAMKPLRQQLRKQLGLRHWYGACVSPAGLRGGGKGNRFPPPEHVATSRRNIDQAQVTEERLLTPEELDVAGAELRSKINDMLQEPFKTDVVKPSLHTSEHVGLYYNVPMKEAEDLFSDELPPKFAEQVKDMRSFDILIRQPSIDISEAIHHVHNTPGYGEAGCNPKILLSGTRGVGKSIVLLHCVHMCQDLGWLIFHLPDVMQTTLKHGRYYNPALRANFYKDDRFDMPEHAATWLGQFVKLNGSKLGDVKLTRTYQLSEKDVVEIDTPVLKAIEIALYKTALASDIMGIVMKEISHTRKFKSLFAMDAYNQLFEGCYRHPTGSQEIRPAQISHLRHFMRALRDDNYMGNGLAVLGLRHFLGYKRDQYPSYHDNGYAREFLNEVGEEFTRPYYDVHVEPYTDKEVASTLNYYHDRRWISRDISLKMYQQTKFLSGSRPSVIQDMSRAM
ncbi:uncharacterized protein LOC135830001 [Sycon ciliatum]|uniref:uncharacterized protein LOC135830001 n=1 Tax=Sycon ciliatum TaxID=27933 RepID=UPI0031F5FD0D